MAVPYTKPALTFEDQLAQLEGRGLIVQNRAAALTALNRISYYRLSAYLFPLRTSDTTFEPGAAFETALWLYEFDRRLRLLVLDAVERVGILARTVITYELAHTSHPFAHNEPHHFDPRFDHAKWYQGFLDELNRARERFLEHFRAKYIGYPRVPIWMASEVMSFGTLSVMFKGMTASTQNRVAARLGAHRSVVASWLHSLSYVRNLCAHHGRLWNRELAIKPLIPSGRPDWAPVANNRVYAVLCIARHLTTPCLGGADWLASARTLLGETDGKPRWQRAMGVPVGWQTHAFWR